MNQTNCIIWIAIFQCLTNLGAGHIELARIILIEITSQSAERLLGSEGEGGSCSGIIMRSRWSNNS